MSCALQDAIQTAREVQVNVAAAAAAIKAAQLASEAISAVKFPAIRVLNNALYDVEAMSKIALREADDFIELMQKEDKNG